MENAKTYITSKLEEIIVVLSELKILYKYDASSKEHLIKVYPIDEVNNNQKYQEIESEIIFSFIDKYPHESLVFFTEDDWINIDNPEKIFQGQDYQEECTYEFAHNDLFSFTEAEDDLIDFVGILYNTKIKFNKIKDELINYRVINEDFEKSQIEDIETHKNDTPDVVHSGGENNFALAA